MSKSSSTTVQDAEDLDDLDDFLPSFATTKPPNPIAGPSTSASHTVTPNTTQDGTGAARADTDDPDDSELDDEAFEAELAKGMESLLRGLGVDPSTSSTGGGIGKAAKGKNVATEGSAEEGAGNRTEGDDEGPSTTAEQDKALEQLFAKLMSGGDLDSDPFAGLKAMADNPSPAGSKLGTGREGKSRGIDPGMGQTADGKPMTLDETIRRTMEKLKTSEEDARAPQTSASEDPLTSLLASLSSLDPETLKNLAGSAGSGGAGGNGEDFGGLLDGMMKQLMTREILEEPLQELGDKFPAYLSSHPNLPQKDLSRYQEQQEIVGKILGIFKKKDYDDENDEMRGEVVGLMTRMQDLGSPPDEIMGDMPEGFDMENGACSIM